MAVREFCLMNKKGQEFSLMDIENYCLLTSPKGLGLEINNSYEQLNNLFITNISKLKQGNISGLLNFKNYDNYKALVDFIAHAESLYIRYKIPYSDGSLKTYYRDIAINSLSKTDIDKDTGVLSETISIDCLSLWYQKNQVIYEITALDDEIRWDFKWDSRFASYDVRDLKYINQGHVPASIELEINGNVLNPAIELYVEGNLYQRVPVNITIAQYEKLLYSSKENDFYIKKQLANGSLVDLFSLDYIDFSNDNVLRIPVDKSCDLRLTADNDIQSAKITIFVYYLAV